MRSPSYQLGNAGFIPLSLIGVGPTLWSVWRLVQLAWRRRTRSLVTIAVGAEIYAMLLIRDFGIGADTSSLGEMFLRQYAAIPLFTAIVLLLAHRYFEALSRARYAAFSAVAAIRSDGGPTRLAHRRDRPSLARARARHHAGVAPDRAGGADECLKHSDASVVTLAVELEPGALVVPVIDNGPGPGIEHGEGRGMRNMHVRAQRIGARWSMAWTPEDCTVRLELPRTSLGT